MPAQRHLAHPRVQCVPQPIAEEVGGDHHDEDGEAGEEDDEDWEE